MADTALLVPLPHKNLLKRLISQRYQHLVILGAEGDGRERASSSRNLVRGDNLLALQCLQVVDDADR